MRATVRIGAAKTMLALGITILALNASGLAAGVRAAEVTTTVALPKSLVGPLPIPGPPIVATGGSSCGPTQSKPFGPCQIDAFTCRYWGTNAPNHQSSVSGISVLTGYATSQWGSGWSTNPATLAQQEVYATSGGGQYGDTIGPAAVHTEAEDGLAITYSTSWPSGTTVNVTFAWHLSGVLTTFISPSPLSVVQQTSATASDDMFLMWYNSSGSRQSLRASSDSVTANLVPQAPTNVKHDWTDSGVSNTLTGIPIVPGAVLSTVAAINADVSLVGTLESSTSATADFGGEYANSQGLSGSPGHLSVDHQDMRYSVAVTC